MELDRAIQERRSIRKFSKKKPDWREIIECIDAARFAPMAGNCYSPRFILIDDTEKIKKLAEASQQPFIAEANYVVIVTSNPDRTTNSFEERAEMYLRQQAGAAIQNFLLKITEKKLATCWIGAFADDLVKEVTGIPGSVKVEALFPIGYELKKPTTRQDKTSLDRILYFNKYGNKNMMHEKKINA